jgi:TfoX/Sxy family transcriptional regulator of competence genes
MAYDHDLADRVRERLADEHAISERAMFGGLVFLLEGNMAIGVSGDGLMVRVGPEGTADALRLPHARPFEMRGRPTKGFVRVDADGVASDEDLDAWVGRGVAFAGSLPPKD